jgi:hypothetical protein
MSEAKRASTGGQETMTTALTLYRIEDDLQALVNSEELVTADQEREFRNQLAEQLRTAVDKRQRVGEFLRYCELQQENCDKEIARVQALKATYATAQERMERYVIHTIKTVIGPDAKGKYPKLAGRTLMLSVARNPDSVDIQDEALIPEEYKSITVKLPAEIWSELLEAFSGDDDRAIEVSKILQSASEKASISIDKAAIKKAIKVGETVDGADLFIGGLRCEVR